MASVLRDGIDTWFIRRIVVCHTVNQFRDWKVQYRIIKFDDASILLKPVVAVASVSYRSSGIMLNWALTFLIVAIIAGLLGFGGIAGEAAWVAHVLFVVFLVLFLVSLIAGRRSPPI